MALSVSLVAADAEVWSGEASLVVAKTVEGEIGFMVGHEPILAILAEGQVRITVLATGFDEQRPAPRRARQESQAATRPAAPTVPPTAETAVGGAFTEEMPTYDEDDIDIPAFLRRR